jgi:hypothetical protein
LQRNKKGGQAVRGSRCHLVDGKLDNLGDIGCCPDHFGIIKRQAVFKKNSLPFFSVILFGN